MAEDGDDEKVTGSTPTVFISYASLDSVIAESVCEALEKAGVTCWIAPRDVVPGSLYAEKASFEQSTGQGYSSWSYPSTRSPQHTSLARLNAASQRRRRSFHLRQISVR